MAKDEYVKIHIDPSYPRLDLDEIIYNKNLKISDISLPKGWRWCWWGNDFDRVPQAGDNYYYVSYDADRAGTNVYKSASTVKVRLRVKQAPAKIDLWPSAAEEITYGEKLSKISLVNGRSRISGNFYWNNSNIVPTVRNSGYQVVFIPTDPNYHAVYQNINVLVRKNMVASNSLTPVLGNSYAKKIVLKRFLGYEYSMNSGKMWQDSCEFSGLNPDTEYNFVCRIKENDNTCAGKISNVFSVSTKKLQTMPANELILEERTNHKVKFKKFENQEYSNNDGITWQDSSEFNDLSGSTSYKFTTRIKANSVYDSGEPTPSISIDTKSFFRNVWNKFKGIFKS